MRRNTYKKISILIYLTIFLFGIFVPVNNIEAQTKNNRLLILADKINFKSGEIVLITAKTYSIGSKEISFTISPNDGSFKESTCVVNGAPTASVWSCTTELKINKEGTFKIKASTNYNGILNSNEIDLIVENGNTTLVCTDPLVLNTNKDACITPPNCTGSQILNTDKNKCIDKPIVITPLCEGEYKLNNAKTGCIKDTDTTYTPLAPIPGTGLEGTINTQKSKTNPCPFGNYLNIIIKLILGISAVLAMVMIVVGGIEYMTSELVSSKESGKETITNAILGLVIALGAYLILNTVNPQLLNVCLDKLPEATIVISPESSREYRLLQTLTTDTKFKKTTYYDKIKSVSATNNIPSCLLQVAIQRESGGIPNQVGHDENVPFPGVPSRKTFVNSGLYYNKTTFTPSNDLITKSSFKNNDSSSGIDWRFSHSVGLFGVTFGPNHGGSAGAQEILNNTDKDIEAAVRIMKGAYESCGKNIEKTFRMYQSGSCNGGVDNPEAFVNKETPLRVSLYNQCISQDK